MASHRIERIDGQIQRELSLLLRQKVKDTRIQEASVSITRVKTTPDLKTADVYVSIFGDDAEKREVLAALQKASGYFRSSVGKILKTHSTPALTFKLDDSVEYGMHIDSILKDLHEKGQVSEELPEEDE
ncbi:MAG: 30S ribosome-binding factor RbfA [Eubacteriaceae bacterium]|jgi:ribosome-binding factor A